MSESYKSDKLDRCKDELRALLERLEDGYYRETAKEVFDIVAHTGVETDQNPELKEEPTYEAFMGLDQDE